MTKKIALNPTVKIKDLKAGDRIMLPDGTIADVHGVDTVEKTIPRKKVELATLSLTTRGKSGETATAVAQDVNLFTFADTKYRVISRKLPWYLIVWKYLTGNLDALLSVLFGLGLVALLRFNLIATQDAAILGGITFLLLCSVAYRLLNDKD